MNFIDLISSFVSLSRNGKREHAPNQKWITINKEENTCDSPYAHLAILSNLTQKKKKNNKFDFHQRITAEMQRKLNNF